MIAHIQGHISQRTPAFVVLDCNGVGYGIQISLNTYSLIPEKGTIKLHTHLIVKEDAHTLFGFVEESERALFLLLISVNGVGPNTARMILNSMKPEEIQQYISSGNWNQLKSVKGIGPKTAQRIVVDLQDKIKTLGQAHPVLLQTQRSSIADEALMALQALGFNRADAEKAIQKIVVPGTDTPVETIIKQALKIL